MDRSFRYWGFLSYSHDDRQVAERLHRALEGYRIPPRLVGLDGPFGPVPARLLPIFRDRDELNAGGQLGPAVETALARSRSLIVLCSPRAAVSPWVDAEIEAFERLHPDAPLFCVVVAGQPLAPPEANGDAAECLPPGARKLFSSQPGMQESAPIAVDLRRDGDGWRLAIHKIVAGLTGLPLDQLVQRDAQRRHRRMAWLSAALAGTAIALGTMAVMAYRARDEARIQRAQAEGLVEFMLVDLRKRLEPVGRLDALDAVGTRALRYYDEQSLESLDPDSLGRRARALHLIGEVGDRRGDTRAARQAFARARAATAELLARTPDHPQRLYDHAQSVYWNGYIDWQHGDFVSAEKAFDEYAKLAARLSAQDPANPEWLAEVGYAHSNLGVLLLQQGRAEEAIPEFRQSLTVNRKLASLATEAEADVVWLDVAQDRAWLSSGYFANRQLMQAIAEREAELEIYERLVRSAPDNAQAKERAMFAHNFLGELYFAKGDLARSDAAVAKAIALADEQRKIDPESTGWQQALAKAWVLDSQVARRNRRYRHAQSRLDAADRIIAAQLARDPEAVAWKVDMQEMFAAEQAFVFIESGNLASADRLLDRTTLRLEETQADVSLRPKLLRFRIAYHAARASLARLRMDADAERAEWKQLAGLAGNDHRKLDGSSAAWLSVAMENIDRSEEAQRLSSELLDSGYGRTTQLAGIDPQDTTPSVASP
jgi:tetratricopeptide (TPR) repeat protein